MVRAGGAAQAAVATGVGTVKSPAASTAPLIADLVDDQQQSWDVFVRACPESSFCHLWSWRRIMKDTLGHECLNAVALDQDGAWRGVLPLVHVKSRIFGHYLISMPFLNAGGPVAPGGCPRQWTLRGAGEPCVNR